MNLFQNFVRLIRLIESAINQSTKIKIKARRNEHPDFFSNLKKSENILKPLRN